MCAATVLLLRVTREGDDAGGKLCLLHWGIDLCSLYGMACMYSSALKVCWCTFVTFYWCLVRRSKV